MGQKSNRKQQRRGRVGERPAGAEEIVRRINVHIESVRVAYADVWRQLADMRRQLREEVAWPDWCWLPLAAAHAVAHNSPLPEAAIVSPVALEVEAPVAVIGALAAWRQTRTIYRLDPDLYDALIATDLADRLPPQAFRRLPEWCVYVALPSGAGLAGLYAHLEWDLNAQRPELRVLYDLGDGRLAPGILYLDRPSISESLLDVLASTLATRADGQSHDIHTHGDRAVEQQWRERALAAGGELEIINEGLRDVRELMHIAISTLLYLCVEEPDILDPDQTLALASHHPAPRGTVPASKPTVWEVGYRFGAATRADRRAQRSSQGRGASPRPHIRRQHWHHYWTGPRAGEQTLIVRWIAPTLVAAVDVDELVPTIRDER
jgi:hypothetical protein